MIRYMVFQADPSAIAENKGRLSDFQALDDLVKRLNEEQSKVQLVMTY